MTPVLARPNTSRARRALPLGSVAVLLVGLIAEVGAWRLTRSPSFVPGVVIDNPAALDIEVEVSGHPHDTWLALGTAVNDRKTRFSEVLDQGRSWRFRFSYGGVVGLAVTLSRSDLADADWTVGIPEAVVSALAVDELPVPP